MLWKLKQCSLWPFSLIWPFGPTSSCLLMFVSTKNALLCWEINLTIGSLWQNGPSVEVPPWALPTSSFPASLASAQVYPGSPSSIWGWRTVSVMQLQYCISSNDPKKVQNNLEKKFHFTLCNASPPHPSSSASPIFLSSHSDRPPASVGGGRWRRRREGPSLFCSTNIFKWKKPGPNPIKLT